MPLSLSIPLKTSKNLRYKKSTVTQNELKKMNTRKQMSINTDQIIWKYGTACLRCYISPLATGHFLYFLKTSGNLSFSDIFTEYRKRPVA